MSNEPDADYLVIRRDLSDAMWQAARTADAVPGDSYSAIWHAMLAQAEADGTALPLQDFKRLEREAAQRRGVEREERWKSERESIEQMAEAVADLILSENQAGVLREISRSSVLYGRALKRLYPELDGQTRLRVRAVAAERVPPKAGLAWAGDDPDRLERIATENREARARLLRIVGLERFKTMQPWGMKERHWLDVTGEG